jgi:hypothetical protein
MAPATLYDRFVEPAPHAHANESGLDPGHSQFRMLRAKRRPDIRLALRRARSSDGDALQTDDAAGPRDHCRHRQEPSGTGPSVDCELVGALGGPTPDHVYQCERDHI